MSPGVFYFDLFLPWASDVFGRCDRHQRSKQIKINTAGLRSLLRQSTLVDLRPLALALRTIARDVWIWINQHSFLHSFYFAIHMHCAQSGITIFLILGPSSIHIFPALFLVQNWVGRNKYQNVGTQRRTWCTPNQHKPTSRRAACLRVVVLTYLGTQRVSHLSFFSR